MEHTRIALINYMIDYLNNIKDDKNGCLIEMHELMNNLKIIVDAFGELWEIEQEEGLI